MKIEVIIEEIGLEADNVDNILHATNLPLPAEFHVEQMKDALARLRDRLRSLHIEASRNNPWKD